MICWRVYILHKVKYEHKEHIKDEFKSLILRQTTHLTFNAQRSIEKEKAYKWPVSLDQRETKVGQNESPNWSLFCDSSFKANILGVGKASGVKKLGDVVVQTEHKNIYRQRVIICYEYGFV